MSFTVYDGLLISDVTTLDEANAFIETLIPEITKTVTLVRADILKHVACLLYDQYHAFEIDAFEPHDEGRIPLRTAYGRLRDMDRDLGTVEYTLSIGAFGGHTLAIPFFNDKESVRTLKEHPQVTPFGYWDNVDPDPDATEDEWETRRRIWSGVLYGTGVPAECMFSRTIVNPNYIIPSDEDMANLPTIEERETSLARTLAFDAVDKMDNIKPSKVMELSKGKYADILPTVVGQLNPDLTLHNLEQTVPKREHVNGS